EPPAGNSGRLCGRARHDRRISSARLEATPLHCVRRNAFAAALRMPDDAALAGVDALLGRLDAEILMRSRQLLHATVKKDEIVQKLDEPLLAAHLEEVLVELEAGIVGLVFFPFKEVLLGRAEGAVQADLARFFNVSQATISRLAAPSPFEGGSAVAQ